MVRSRSRLRARRARLHPIREEAGEICRGVAVAGSSHGGGFVGQGEQAHADNVSVGNTPRLIGHRPTI
jgi:hypothetical protein